MKRVSILIVSVAIGLFSAFATQPSGIVNADTGPNALGLPGEDTLYQINESGWSGYSETGDTQYGWGDDQWQINLSSTRVVSIHVLDCCIVGDNYEIWVDSAKVGSTPARRMYDPLGYSDAVVKTTVGAGSHLIRAKDVGGAYYANHGYPIMIPAGYDVTITTDAPAPPPESGFPDFKQRAGQWDKPGDHLAGLTACPTIASAGCALTSVTDILAFNQTPALTEGYGAVDPGNLNRWLSQPSKPGAGPRGYDGCGIRWHPPATASGGYVSQPEPPYRARAADSQLSQINRALDRGLPAVVEVHVSSWSHYVVVVGYLRDSYAFVDPDGQSTSVSGKTLKEKYGSTYDVFVYPTGPLSKASLSVSGHSPIELLLTDPHGAQSGYDPATGMFLDDIPVSSYGLEHPAGDDDGVLPPPPPFPDFEVVDPLVGEYSVEVVGTGDGPFTLQFVGTNQNGDSTEATVSGFIHTGEVQTFSATFDSLSPTPIVLANQPVGGIAELPDIAVASPQEAAAPAEPSGWSPANYAVLAAGFATAGLAIAAGAWYARRRRPKA